MEDWLARPEGDHEDDSESDSDPEGAERDDDEGEYSVVPFSIGREAQTHPALPPPEAAAPRLSARARTQTAVPENTESPWYPWADKEVRIDLSLPCKQLISAQSCVLDVMRHLPRSIFSDSQMESIEWCMTEMGCEDIPSVSVLKAIDQILQNHCGIETLRYEGPLGHTYYANALDGLIAQVCVELSHSRLC